MHPGQLHAKQAVTCIQGNHVHIRQSHASRAIMCITVGTDSSLMLERESMSLTNTVLPPVTNQLSVNMQRGCGLYMTT